MATTDRRGSVVGATDPATATDPNPGRAIKAPCRVATTAAITLSGLQTIDGVSLNAGDRVLVKNQTDQSTNGIYVVGTSTWARSVDANETSEFASGMEVVCTSGTANANNIFVLTTADPIILGTSLLAFSAPLTPPFCIEYTHDGGAGPVATGNKGYLEIPQGCTIQRWTMLADTAGSMVIDIWKTTYALAPPAVANTITGSALPTLAAVNKNQSAVLTGWTTALQPGDVLAFNVNSTDGLIRRVTISLYCSRP